MLKFSYQSSFWVFFCVAIGMKEVAVLAMTTLRRVFPILASLVFAGTANRDFVMFAVDLV